MEADEGVSVFSGRVVDEGFGVEVHWGRDLSLAVAKSYVTLCWIHVLWYNLALV
jgi:hypothetical protein